MNDDKETAPASVLGYHQGFIDGITAYAYWKDGVQHVGTTGRTHADAVEDVKNTWNYSPIIINREHLVARRQLVAIDKLIAFVEKELEWRMSSIVQDEYVTSAREALDTLQAMKVECEAHL